MAIEKLSKVTFYGYFQNKNKVLAGLQEMGCLHILPLKRKEELRAVAGPTKQSQEALKFLLSYPERRHQIHDPEGFDALQVERTALDLQERILDLGAERDALRKRITDLKPWGDFSFPPLEEMNGLRFWFYVVPLKQMEEIEKMDLRWKAVNKDNRFFYVIVVSDEEPQDMPVLRVHTGAKSLTELKHRLEEVEVKLEDLQDERAELTHWCDLYIRNLHNLQNQAAISEAAGQTYDQHEIFALQGWVPKKKVKELEKYSKEMRLAVFFEAPAPDEEPPTLLKNAKPVAGGQDLVSFYMTPGYRLWDPSTIVFFSFAIFFAMILSDFGYAMLLGLVIAFFWKKMGKSDGGKRMRIVFLALIIASAIWGVLVGSYFGLSPNPNSWLGKLKIIDLNNEHSMMALTISIGAFHVILANLLDAWRRRWSPIMLAPIGWAVLILGGIMLWVSNFEHEAVKVFDVIGPAVMGFGAFLILLFSGHGKKLGFRLIGGVMAMARLSAAFGDILSYLRLFALGLASASLAVTFNQLGRDVAHAIPGAGIIFAFFIIVVGHALNFLLAIVSGFIHGLRLNFIEFFNWSMYEEGKPFRPFAKKGGIHWKHSS